MKIGTRHSTLLSASCILVFFNIAFADKLFTCQLPQNFALQISNGRRAYISQPHLTIHLISNGLTITPYMGNDSLRTNIQTNNVKLNFTGFIYIENENQTEEESIEPKIPNKYTDSVSGTLLFQGLNSTDINDCRALIMTPEMERPDMDGNIRSELHRLAEPCLEYIFCLNYNATEPAYMRPRPGKGTPGVVPACPEPTIIDTEDCISDYSIHTPQPALNTIMDMGLAWAIKFLKNLNGGTFAVPDIDKQFTTGSMIFTTSGHFRAVNGTFSDLTKLRRRSDVILTQEGKKLTAGCSFGLDTVNLNYANYNLDYGIVSVDGKMSGTVQGITLAIRVAVDYKQNACRLSIDQVKFTEFGDINVDLTGLGMMSDMISKLSNWATNSWRDEIVTTLENELATSINHKLSKIDCNKYITEITP